MNVSEADHAFFITRDTSADPRRGPRLAFDPEGVLHRPLTQFAEFARRRLADESVRSYLSALCRYFTWLRHSRAPSRRWDTQSTRVRADVLEYLVAVFGCHVREHRLGFMTVRLTGGQRSGVSGFLSALRLFYSAMVTEGLYGGLNPLGRHLVTQDASGNDLNDTAKSSLTEFPKMPLVSGCVAEPRSSRQRDGRREHGATNRLTDAYFVIVDERWTPQPVDDYGFPARIFAAGEKARWRLREVLITRLLFETGARVHEICALTLGDWLARGLRQEATSINKGSNQRRVKFVRWSASTTKLLQRYFDGDRLEADPTHRTRSTYLAQAKRQSQLLHKVPLFLTAQGGALTAKTFRDLYWRLQSHRSGRASRLSRRLSMRSGPSYADWAEFYHEPRGSKQVSAARRSPRHFAAPAACSRHRP